MASNRQDKASRRRRRREPLQVHLSMVVRTGPDPEDQLTLLNNRKLYMLGSVFEYRARMQRFLVAGLLRVATTSPRVYREIAPGLSAMLDGLRSRRRGRKAGK
jgi:hypothetical protein